MKKTILTLLVPVAVAIFAACATLQVTTDYDHSKDFSTLKTYALHDNTANSKTVSSLNGGRIVAAIKSTLNAKGYTEVASNPTFLVNANAVVKTKQSVSANTDFYGMGGPYAYGGMYRPYGYWGGAGMVTANTSFNVEEYKEGSLIIDMIDCTTGKMFWQGIGNSEIDNIKNPDQKIADAVTKIMASFPNAGMQPSAKK